MDLTRLDWWNKDELYNEATMDQLVSRYKVKDKGLKSSDQWTEAKVSSNMI